MKKAIFVSTFTFLILISGCLAQSDWSALCDLGPGTRVVILERSGAETKARVSRADDTTMFLAKGRTIARDSIARVYLTKRGSILKRALIGAAAGAGIGVAVGVGLTAATKSNGLAAAGGFLIGIPAGAAVGAVTVGRKRGRLIYESP